MKPLLCWLGRIFIRGYDDLFREKNSFPTELFEEKDKLLIIVFSTCQSNVYLLKSIL